MALLEVFDIRTYYGNIAALKGVSLEVNEGEIVTLIGSNGAGKSTTLKAISGLLPSEDGEITEGVISYRGKPITRLDAAKIVRLGISQVMEGRRVFEHLTVHENLVAGAYARRGAKDEDFELVYNYFPTLADMRGRVAGYLSGGEQQMLAIGRALMARPRLLMLDEPSLGLAPLLVQEIFGYIRALNDETGLTVLVIEQNARRALEIADHGYVLEQGRIVLDGPARDLSENPDVKEFYLGMGEGGRKNYRDVKHYKRRKRWL